ncbi:MAG: hypothetical protein WC979_01930 [Candidatus Pacearchaeota archaeon]|jgi:hypothetical protein|nr:glycosyltransferase [Clostridia bacterium]
MLSDFNINFGFVREIVTVLSEMYNLVFIGEESDKTIPNGMSNFYTYNLTRYKQINGKEFKRKAENKDNAVHNLKILTREFDNSFPFTLDRILFANDIYYILPLTSYISKELDPTGNLQYLQNEFHDYVGNNTSEIDLRKKAIEQVCSNYDNRVSLLAFSMYTKNMFINVVKYFHDKKPLKCLYSFSVDPAAFLEIFDYYGIPQKRFYFADDNRGTRKFEEFPIAHLQHITHEENVFGNVDTTKTKDLFYVGTILHSKGHRKDMWDKYFKDLNLTNSSMWIPIKANGLFMTEKQVNSHYGQSAATKANELFGELVEQIKKHPMHKGHMYTKDVRKTLAEYKYGIVLKCVSFSDSLNPRPVFYTYLGILPLITCEYDPEFIGIPKSIQDKIVVSNHKDIEERVKYFNEHEEERQAILKELWNHFKIDEYKENWKEIVKQKFQ